MRTTAIVCAVLAGSLGFGSLAVAQDHRGDRGDRHERWEQRQDRREARQDRREDRRDERRDARDDRRDRQAWRQDRREDRAYHNGYHAGRHDGPRYVYNAPRFHRGGYLPHEYRNRAYYVNNWNAYPRLYSPPYGHQWVNVGGEFLLVALASGLIANALIN